MYITSNIEHLVLKGCFGNSQGHFNNDKSFILLKLNNRLNYHKQSFDQK